MRTWTKRSATMALALVLIVLGIGPRRRRYGIPARFGRSRPCSANGSSPSFLQRSVTTLSDAQVGEVGEPPASEAGGATGEGLELTLMVVSSIVAIVGIGLAWSRSRLQGSRDLADKAARAFQAALQYRLLLNKYYVDELYDAAIVQPIRVDFAGSDCGVAST